MSTIPKSVLEKIEEKYPLPIAKIIPDDYYNEDFTNRYMEMEILQKTAQWGYQLATDGREELEKLILEMAADRRELASKYNDLVEFKESIEKGDDRYYKQIE